MKVVALNPHPEASFALEEEALAPLGVRIERVRAASEAEALAAAADADVVIGRVSSALIAGLGRCRHIPCRPRRCLRPGRYPLLPAEEKPEPSRE